MQAAIRPPRHHGADQGDLVDNDTLKVARLEVEEDIVFHRGAINELRKRLAEYKIKSTKITIPQSKELAGVTRRYAMALIEYLDREHVTLRVGDESVIL
jgi:selenocysteine-specific elongation factor